MAQVYEPLLGILKLWLNAQLHFDVGKVQGAVKKNADISIID